MKPTSWLHADHYIEFSGALLRAYRTDEGWSQAELARRVGCSRAQMSNWECGRQTPNLANIDALADALGISRAALLDEDEVAFS